MVVIIVVSIIIIVVMMVMVVMVVKVVVTIIVVKVIVIIIVIIFVGLIIVIVIQVIRVAPFIPVPRSPFDATGPDCDLSEKLTPRERGAAVVTATKADVDAEVGDVACCDKIAFKVESLCRRPRTEAALFSTAAVNVPTTRQRSRTCCCNASNSSRVGRPGLVVVAVAGVVGFTFAAEDVGVVADFICSAGFFGVTIVGGDKEPIH